MSIAFSSKYDPAAVESAVWADWEAAGCFHADPADDGEPYCIVIPPPNVTGALHMGHALNNTLQDILIRVHRMKGFNAVWIPGVDHAGIATQAVVEKQLKEQENKTRHDVGREGLVQRIWAWKEQYGNRIVEQLKRLGCSCDWSRQRFTLDEVCGRAVRHTFYKLFRDGLVFRGKRLVNWDTHLQTSISDDELYTQPVQTSLWSIRYPIDGTDDYVTIATTRPETMLADTAVAYHSTNPRAPFLRGRFVRLPLTNRLVPLIEDDELVDPEFGTGYVKVTPGHDPNDYAVYQRHLGKPTEIAILNMMTPDGRVNDADPSWRAYAGLPMETAARKQVLSDLARLGFHDPEKDVCPHQANVNYSDRSKTPIQPFLSDQWFVRMAGLAEPALEAVRSGKVRFFPERHAQQYLAWLGEKRDWPISRQLWWGHRIPIWKREAPLDASPQGNVAAKLPQIPGVELCCREHIDAERGVIVTTVCTSAPSAWLENELAAMGFVQEEDVLDTWFSSGLWPHSVLGWPDDTPELRTWYPGSVLVTGRDIITLWVARMVMMGLYNLGEVPFRHVAINPTILDGKGERMSKSKGNGVDPVDIIETHGADALRFTLATMATETQDVRLPVKKDDRGRNTSEKFDLGRNFCTKLWNASRFVIGSLAAGSGPQADTAAYTLADRWILARLSETLRNVDLALASYRFDAYAKAAYDFVWGDFCDWYLEAVKPTLKDPRTAARAGDVLAAVLDASLRILHPIVPFISEAVWKQLGAVRNDRSIAAVSLPPSTRLIRARWPSPPAASFLGDVSEFDRLCDLVVALRNVRNEHKVEPRRTLEVRRVAGALSPEAQVHVQQLAGVRFVDAGEAATAARVIAAGIELEVLGVVDQAAEAQRLSRRRDELKKLIATLEQRLASPAYVEKAPPTLVAQTRQQLAEARDELARLSPA